MLFTEFRFLIFFAAAFAVYWTLPRNDVRKGWLLVCSYSFYAAWDWRFLSLILISTAVDYGVGLAMVRTEVAARRKHLLWLSLTVNLGLLGFFKYTNFFLDSAVELSRWLGFPASESTLQILLPVGISFYTFQTLSYTIDLYRRQIEVTRSPLDFALFVGFFPQLVAGPIVRARDFLPQLLHRKSFTHVNARYFLALFLVGYIKKACVGDHIARVVDPVFAQPEIYGAAAKWLASFLYTVQIYCDFSGYSDMAIATAGLLGYHLTENFAFPYLSRSFRDYWQRWHISLSTWFRDYLYIPLGGNRGGSRRTAINLFFVFSLCGLWHGAAWTVLIWGLYQGLFLSLERFVPVDRMPKVVGHLYVMLFANAGFIIFRSADLATAGTFLAGLVGAATSAGAGALQSIPAEWWLLLLAFALMHILFERLGLERTVERVPDWLFAPAYGVAAALALPWAAAGYQPFIYFQF
jgi:alginate O-acetyltransferase complex protein AlgI